MELGSTELTTIILTSFIDSINPCAIGVLILFISTLLAASKPGQVLKTGLIFITSIFVTYLMFGIILASFFSSVPVIYTVYISLVVAVVMILAGIIQIKDFFWYGKGISLSIPSKITRLIEDQMDKMSNSGIIFLGVFVALIELPCTGGPYLGIATLLAQNFNESTFILLVIYNLVFILPLVVILILVQFGTSLVNIQIWKQENKHMMRLTAGYLLVALGWLLILIANGTINLK